VRQVNGTFVIVSADKKQINHNRTAVTVQRRNYIKRNEVAHTRRYNSRRWSLDHPPSYRHRMTDVVWGSSSYAKRTVAGAFCAYAARMMFTASSSWEIVVAIISKRNRKEKKLTCVRNRRLHGFRDCTQLCVALCRRLQTCEYVRDHVTLYTTRVFVIGDERVYSGAVSRGSVKQKPVNTIVDCCRHRLRRSAILPY
jgi:hypothetical protein